MCFIFIYLVFWTNLPSYERVDALAYTRLNALEVSCLNALSHTLFNRARSTSSNPLQNSLRHTLCDPTLFFQIY